MRIAITFFTVLTIVGGGIIPSPAGAQDHQHRMTEPAPGAGDARQLVKFPEPMRLHTITSMRDHLLALQEINAALSVNAFDKAASIAEQRLGMSSLERRWIPAFAGMTAALVRKVVVVPAQA